MYAASAVSVLKRYDPFPLSRRMAAPYVPSGPERIAMLILSDLDNLLWAVGVFGNVALLAVLLLRHRATHFPFFTTFIAGSVLRSLLLLALARHYVPHTYFLSYWSLAILVDVVLQSAVVYETAGHVFRPLGHWAADARRGMGWIIAGSFFTAGVLAWLAIPVSAIWQRSLVEKGDFFFYVLMSELLIGMVMLSVTVGLPWRTHVARIAQGLGAYSLLNLALEAGHSLYGAEYKGRVDLLLTDTRKVFYLSCVVYWVATLWQDAPEPRQLPLAARQHLRDLQARITYDLYTLRSGRRP